MLLTIPGIVRMLRGLRAGERPASYSELVHNNYSFYSDKKRYLQI